MENGNLSDLEWQKEQAEIERRFSEHKTNSKQREKMKAVRNFSKDLAFAILANVPQGRERALALTKIEEACFWSNAGISREIKK